MELRQTINTCLATQLEDTTYPQMPEMASTSKCSGSVAGAMASEPSGVSSRPALSPTQAWQPIYSLSFANNSMYPCCSMQVPDAVQNA
jgi:hypothetical protein